METRITRVLSDTGIYDWLKSHEYLYVGGSLISYLMCHDTFDDTLMPPRDIDIYTTNHVASINDFNNTQFFVCNVVGCIINFKCKRNTTGLGLQFITAEVDDFYNDVLGNYDCDLVCVGFHPFSNTTVVHDRYKTACETGKFVCHKDLSSLERCKKLQLRIEKWYDGHIVYTGEQFGRVEDYYGQTEMSKSYLGVLDFVVPPKYIQLFYNKYKCIKCHTQGNNLLCIECAHDVLSKFAKCDTEYGAVVIGGLNGFGNIIKNMFMCNCVDVICTSRKPNGNNCLEFQLGIDMSHALLNSIQNADILVLNATKTLDGQEEIWNNYLCDFDKGLLLDRINTNVLGYTLANL